MQTLPYIAVKSSPTQTNPLYQSREPDLRIVYSVRQKRLMQKGLLFFSQSMENRKNDEQMVERRD